MGCHLSSIVIFHVFNLNSMNKTKQISVTVIQLLLSSKEIDFNVFKLQTWKEIKKNVHKNYVCSQVHIFEIADKKSA